MVIPIDKDNMPNQTDLIDGLNLLLSSFARMTKEYDAAKDKDTVIEIMVDYILRDVKTLKNITRKAGSLNTISNPYLEKFRDDIYKQLGHSSKAPMTEIKKREKELERITQQVNKSLKQLK